MKLTRVLIIIPGIIPSTIIGVMRPLAELESRGEIRLRFRLHGFSPFLSSDIDWCDVAVFCRNCEIKDLYTLYEVKRRGKKVVYELDDNFEEIPLSTNIGIHHRSFFRLHVLRRFFSLSDTTRIYSDRLEERALAHGAKVQRIRSYFNKSLIEGVSRRTADGIVRIAYPTGRIDDRNLEELLYSAVRVILEKYPGQVEFHLWRKDIPQQLRGSRGIVLNEAMSSYDEFIRSFYRAGFDIGLAPGVDNPFFQSKTNNKYREFGGCGIAGVYSNVPPYSNTLVHERQGLLAGGSTVEWVEAIERLIVDKNLRRKIVNNAREDVFNNYSLEGAIDSWHECLVQVINFNSKVPTWLPRPRQTPFVAVVNLRTDGGGCEKGGRDFYLNLACSKIRNCKAKYFNTIAEYLNYPHRVRFCATLVKVDDSEGFYAFVQFVEMCTSVIIDFTRYSGDITRAVSRLQESSSRLPISFILTSSQLSSVEQALGPQAAALEVADAPTQIDQDFSLLGYPAAYLDIIERHTCYAGFVKRSPIFLYAAGWLSHGVKLFSFFKRRLYVLMRFVKWRFGVREF